MLRYVDEKRLIYNREEDLLQCQEGGGCMAVVYVALRDRVCVSVSLYGVRYRVCALDLAIELNI